MHNPTSHPLPYHQPVTTRRGTRQWRKLRAHWQQILTLIWEGQHPTRTTFTCRRCGQPIHPNQPWDLGHDNDVATHGNNTHNLEPEHANQCNRAAGGRLRHTLTRPLPPSRNW